MLLFESVTFRVLRLLIFSSFLSSWATGSKTLNINTVFEILLNLYNGNDWSEAITNAVPSRKLNKKGITPGYKKYYKE